jgi:hypothetical protein
MSLLLLDLDLFVFVVIVLLASKSCLYQLPDYRYPVTLRLGRLIKARAMPLVVSALHFKRLASNVASAA